MSAIFFLALIVVLAGLAGLALQNLSFSISLVFLGLRLQPIPLGFLILGAIAAGVVTGLVVIGLLNLSNYLVRRRLQRVPKPEGPRPRPLWQGSTDADGQTSDADTWGAEPDDRASSFEAEQQPKTTHQSGSTYSYSYRDDNETGVGRPESVVDAEYRVVTPPYQTTNPEDEDYGFDFDDEDLEDDENFEDKGKPHSQR